MRRRPGVKSRQGLAAFGCVFLACLAPAVAQPGASRTEEASFACAPGDSLYLLLDHGRVQLHAWNQPRLDVRARIWAQGDGRTSNVQVVSEKHGRRIDIRAYFYEFNSEDVQIDIEAPAYIDVNIWGLTRKSIWPVFKAGPGCRPKRFQPVTSVGPS